MGYLAFVQTVKSTATQDLTTLGGLDWRHWSGFSLSSSTRKTSGAGISNLSAIGSITNDQATNAGRTVTASDPTLSATSAGIYYGANGTTGWGVRLTIDVGTTRRKCYLLIGQFSSATKIDISLSDSSASAISYTYSASAPYATEGMLVEFDLEANSAGQTATVDITCSTNVDFGRTGVQAVALSNAGSGAQTLTPSLFTNSQTFYSPTVTRGAVNLAPSLFTNTSTIYSPVVTSRKTLTPALFTNTNTFYSPTVVVGTVTLLPSLFTNSQVFYSPTVTQGGVTLLPGLLTNISIFYNPTVTTGGVTLQPSLFTNTQTFYSATINRGLVTLSPSLVTNNQTFFSPSVTTRNTLLPSLFTNNNTFYNPTVTSNKVLQPPLLTNTSIFYSAIVSQPGVTQTLLPSLVVNTQTFFSPLVFDSSFNFRITENGDTRITEDSDTRILEGDSSAATLEGIGSITADLKITKAARANLEGTGNLEASAEVLPFESTLYIKVNGVWKTATPYVKVDNIWRIPSYVGKKINGAWRRIY